ncbi:response regulator transcription factor [Bacteroidota bacterium]
MGNKKEIKLIIADDNITFIEGITLLLQKFENIEILEICNNGLEVINSKNLSKADLLILDIQMPKMNGIETAKKINFMFPKLPMIALTMFIESVYLDEIISSGFKGFIYKPEVFKDLKVVIDMVLDGSYVFPSYLKTIE